MCLDGKEKDIGLASCLSKQVKFSNYQSTFLFLFKQKILTAKQDIWQLSSSELASEEEHTAPGLAWIGEGKATVSN
jgi:hypothetical protein